MTDPRHKPSPDEGECYVYTDASCGTFAAGLGYVIERPNGSIEGCRSMEADHTSMEAEYYALMEGLRVTRDEYGTSHEVMCYVDVKPLVEKLTVPQPSGDWEDRRRGYERFASKFNSCNVEWIPRNWNARADARATDGLDDARDR